MYWTSRRSKAVWSSNYYLWNTGYINLNLFTHSAQSKGTSLLSVYIKSLFCYCFVPGALYLNVQQSKSTFIKVKKVLVSGIITIINWYFNQLILHYCKYSQVDSSEKASHQNNYSVIVIRAKINLFITMK